MASLSDLDRLHAGPYSNMRHAVATFIYKRLASDWGGSESVPCDHTTLAEWRIGREENDRVICTTNNDAFELWIGYPHKWLFHCRREEARKLAWGILWKWWIVGEWFGLRRRLWYWALHVKVNYRKSATDAARAQMEKVP